MRGWSRFLAYCVMFIVWQMGNCSRSSKKISFKLSSLQELINSAKKQFTHQGSQAFQDSWIAIAIFIVSVTSPCQ